MGAHCEWSKPEHGVKMPVPRAGGSQKPNLGGQVPSVVPEQTWQNSLKRDRRDLALASSILMVLQMSCYHPAMEP